MIVVDLTLVVKLNADGRALVDTPTLADVTVVAKLKEQDGEE